MSEREEALRLARGTLRDLESATDRQRERFAVDELICRALLDCERDLATVREALKVYEEFYEASADHEDGVLDFDLHAEQVERLRSALAAVAAFRSQEYSRSEDPRSYLEQEGC